MFFTRWLLFFTMSIYFILDYFHTRALIDYGLKELNPFVLFIIGKSFHWQNLLFLKILLITILGIFLLIDQVQKRGILK